VTAAHLPEPGDDDVARILAAERWLPGQPDEPPTDGPLAAPARPGGSVPAPAGPVRYRAVLDALDEVVFQTDAAGVWTFLNDAWTKITGFGVAETLGTHFLDYVHPDELTATVELFRSVIEGGLDHCHHETRYRTADGGYRWLELRSSVLRDPGGAVIGNVGTILDITARRQAQEQLADQARVLEMIACDKPTDETLQVVALLLAQHLRCRVAISIAPDAEDGDSGGVLAVGRPDGGAEEAGGLQAVPAGGRHVQVAVTARNGSLIGRIVVFDRDRPGRRLDQAETELLERCATLVAIAVERGRADAAARHLALHDPLTGLPNRTLYQDRLQQALTAAKRNQGRVALLMIDLDHFKMVNDTLGHETGDRVLREVARRLVASLRTSDTVCRLGGDEFVVVLPDLAEVGDAEHLARKVYSALRQPLDLDGAKLHLEFSVGIGVSALAGSEATTLLRQADVAMYRAKRGGGPALYDPLSDAGRLKGIDLAGELLQAIEREQLVLHYQPRIDLRRGEVVGLEALVRWRHPTLGLVLPDLFVPLAETTSAIKPLSLWVLRRALADRRSWHDQGIDIAVAVNLSTRILHDVELPDLVRGAIEETGVDARGLELEITESTVMADPEGALSAMSRLAAAGVAFSIDDFGTGYSSLSYLKRLPARSLKIDKSFVLHMDTDERDASIVRSAIELAHSLGMDVVAEGVERASVRRMLALLRCDEAQGFDIARPMPAHAVPTWFRTRTPPPRR